MISKILVANRGEIAIRIMRACRELGIKSVAVYSDADKNALFAKYADEAYHIGPAQASESYLNINRIIETALLAGAQAIHPGYGFLSENPSFGYACEQAGIKFIGPSSKVLALMGNKVAARVEMKKAGVPVVPGCEELRHQPAAGQSHRRPGGLSGHRQTLRRRRRHRHEGGRLRGRPGRSYRRLAEDGGQGLRRAGRLYRKVHQPAAPHRVPDHGRQLRQRGLPGGARVLHPAALPEAHRGKPVSGHHAGAAEQDGRDSRQSRQMGGLRKRRHGRVHLLKRRVLLYGGQHARAGGAPGDRDGDRHRHRQGADTHRPGAASLVQAGRHQAQRLGYRVPHQRRRPAGRLRPLHRQAARLPFARAARA